MSDERPTPLDFLTAVYCNEGVPLSVRMKAAIEAAPYRHAKLVAMANLSSDDFAALLDRAIERSQGAYAKVIPHESAEGPED